jgi:hypothetical protein
VAAVIGDQRDRRYRPGRQLIDTGRAWYRSGIFGM